MKLLTNYNLFFFVHRYVLHASVGNNSIRFYFVIRVQYIYNPITIIVCSSRNYVYKLTSFVPRAVIEDGEWVLFVFIFLLLGFCLVTNYNNHEKQNTQKNPIQNYARKMESPQSDFHFRRWWIQVFHFCSVLNFGN